MVAFISLILTSSEAQTIGTNPTSPAKGTATLTDAQAADLQGDRWYINIHTNANCRGEIRGQVVK